MAKAGKSGKSGSGTGIPQKHLHSRISYLYQAALYLSTVEPNVEKEAQARPEIDSVGLLGSGQSEERLKPVKRSDDHNTSSEAKDSRKEESENRLGSRRNFEATCEFPAQTHQLLASMRSISQKSQIRLSQSIKRSVCRRCNGLLTLNNTTEIENPSREGRRPWADVLVVRCCQCGFVKRYPVGMEEAQNRKTKKKIAHAAGTSKPIAGDVKHVIQT